MLFLYYTYWNIQNIEYALSNNTFQFYLFLAYLNFLEAPTFKVKNFLAAYPSNQLSN